MYFSQTFEQLNEIACHWRRCWGIENSLKSNFFRVLKYEFPKHFPKFKLQPLPEDRLPGVLAFCDRSLSTIGLKQTVAIGADQVRPHPTEIATEEIAHWLLDHPGRRYRKTDDVRRRADEDIDIQERESRRLSALLRAPIYLCTDCFNVEDLMAKFSFESDDAALHLEDLIRHRKKTCTGIEDSKNIVDIRSRATTSGRKFSHTHRWDVEENFIPPSAELIAVVDINLGSPAALCAIYGYDSTGRFINFDIRGSQKNYRLPFAQNHVFLQFLRNVENFKIKLVGWHDPKAGDSDIVRVENTFSIQNDRYSGEPCENCESSKVIRTRTMLKCDDCGWKKPLQLKLNFGENT